MFFKSLDHSDVCDALGSSAAEHETNTLTACIDAATERNQSKYKKNNS